MKKVYCASPFFNEKEIMIRDLMVESFKKQNKNWYILRPDLTKDSDNFDANPSNETATKLLDRNLSDIDKADILMFPKYTNDLGTLFEVGYAIRKGKKIIRFDYLSWTFDEVTDLSYPMLPEGIVYLGNISGAIILGYNYSNSNLGYYLPKGMNDNIMLSKFRRFVDAKELKYKLNKTLIEVKVKVNYGITKSGEKCSRILTNNYKGKIPRYVVMSNNLDELDYLVCTNDLEDPTLMKLFQMNFDKILGDGQSVRKLYTGVS